MAMKSVVDNLDGLDESLHEHYKLDTKTNKYILDIENADAHPRIHKLKDESAQNRIKAREYETQLSEFKVLGDLTEVQAKLARIPELEEAAKGKIDETTIQNMVENRVKIRVAPLEREIGTLKTQLSEKDTVIGKYVQQDFSRSVADTVRVAATELNMLPTAVEDAVLLAERNFKRDESTGELLNPDGLNIKSWLTDLQPKRPHWWPASEGAGARGGRGGSGGGAGNPFTHEHWNLTEQGRILQADPAQADRLAKAAGTKVGGSRPAPKK